MVVKTPGPPDRLLCAFSKDETKMGFSFPKAERDGKA